MKKINMSVKKISLIRSFLYIVVILPHILYANDFDYAYALLRLFPHASNTSERDVIRTQFLCTANNIRSLNLWDRAYLGMQAIHLDIRQQKHGKNSFFEHMRPDQVSKSVGILTDMKVITMILAEQQNPEIDAPALRKALFQYNVASKYLGKIIEKSYE